jgi:hypothetical protein
MTIKLVEKLPKSLLSFLGGFFVCFGAMQSVGIIAFPIIVYIPLAGQSIDKVQRLATAMPFINLGSLILGLLVAYVVLQLYHDKLFRRGVIWATSINIMIGIAGILG